MAKDRGAPPGSIVGSPYATPMSFEEEQGAIDDLVGGGTPTTTDPAFQPPHDPLAGPSTKSRATLVYRDPPLVTIQNAWSVDQARGALYAHNMGIFERSSQLWDSILGDPRVTATLGSRATGLFGREVRFKPANDSAAAKECCDAWAEWWPKLSGCSGIRNLSDTAIGMGFAPAQLVWDTTRPVWGPLLRPWHPRYVYWNWDVLKYVALSQDGNIAIQPGNGKWVNHTIFGEYRGWIRGAIRPITEPWMLRHFGARDFARFSETHGLPTRVGKVPAVSDPGDRAAFEASLSRLGSDTAMILPQGVDGADGSGYEYELVEARDTAHECFPMLIAISDTDIVLALLFQNLTTEVKQGSHAATSSHMDIRQSGIQGDNAAWKSTLHDQIASPFAYFNFGDASLAPWTDWDVAPRADFAMNADQFQKFGTAVEVLRRGGVEFTDPEELRKFAEERFGLTGMPAIKITTPVGSGQQGGNPNW